MGLLPTEEGAQPVFSFIPHKMADFELESRSNATSRNSSPQSTSPNPVSGLLTLPTVLQDPAYEAKEHAQQQRVSTASASSISSESFDSPLDPARTISMLDLYTQNKLFLPVLPKPFYNIGVSGMRWLSENPLRQRGLRFRPEEDPTSFVMCQLCGNSILGNREINLQNHARRHSTLKQFQCCYCHYVHSEITKVRLHMAHNHNDNCSRPINNVNTEMRESWRALMNDCFPGHPFVNEQLQRRYTQQATAAAIQIQRMRSGIDYSQFRYCPF